MSIETSDKELTEVRLETDAVIQEAQVLASAIQDSASYKKAGEFWLKAKGLEKKIKAYFKPIKDAMNRAKQEVMDKENEALKRAESIQGILSPAMQKYEQEQERVRREAEAKAQAEARRIEEEQRLAAAVEAEQAGMKQEAEVILETPATVPAVSIPKERVEMDNGAMHTRSNWKANVINMRELVAGVMRGEVPLTALEPNMTVLNQAARTFKNEGKWAGVQFVEEVIRVGRTS